MDWTVGTYAVYLVIVVPLTVWVARTLSRHGTAFLGDVFGGDEQLADAVNRLLVVGFYLLNLGFVSLYLRIGSEVVGLRGLLEELSLKVGVVTLVLGVLHVANVYVFNAMRRRHRLESMRVAPLAPQQPAGSAYGPAFPAPGR